MKKLITFILCAILICACVPFSVSAAGDKTVVFLDTMASGDGSGSSPENAVATLEDAFAALDLSKDCTIVVSGYFLQMQNFLPTESYEGSVTFTSVYDGVDYRRTNQAAYSVNNQRFFCPCEVKFEYIDIEMQGNFYLVVAQCNPFTLGNGVEMITLSAGTTGLKFGNAFSILGGYQGTGDGGQLIESETKDVNITVMSGDYILIGAYNRQAAACNHSGKANITVGGTAHVYKLYTPSVNVNDVSCGDVEVTIRGEGKVDILYGAVKPNLGVTVNSLVVNWNSGSFGPYITPLDGSAEGLEEADLRTTYTNGYTLKYSEHVANNENLELAKMAFEKAEQVSGITLDVVETEAPEPETEPVTEPVTDAPATEPVTDAPATDPVTDAPATDAPATDAPATDAPATDAPSTKAPATTQPADESNGTVIIIIAVAAVVVLAVVIVVIAKKKAEK